MNFDEVSGVLSGTPTASGEFQFSVSVSENAQPPVEKNYLLTILSDGEIPPPEVVVDTASVPVEGGTTSGDGSYQPGADVTVTATPAPGYRFVEWTDNGDSAGGESSITFVADVNHSYVAYFEALAAGALPDLLIGASPTSLIGNDVYNASGAGQTIKRIASWRRKGQFHFKVQNDSANEGPISVKATRGDRTMQVVYFLIAGSRRNVTAGITRSGILQQTPGLDGKAYSASVAIRHGAKKRSRALVVQATTVDASRDTAVSILRIK